MNDEKHHLIYNSRWQMVALFVDDSDTPREQFLPHAAGLDGRGGSSYIDGVVLRQKDTNDNGTLDTRHYYCQNWRADVSAIVSSSGKMVEWVKYSAYGIPFGLPGGDTDSDGDCDAADVTAITAGGGYDVRKDTELDGDNDAADASRATSNFLGTTLGWNALSRTAVGNRKGYSGHEHDATVDKLIHMRNRAYKADLGRFTRRDPLGYVDGMSLYEYVASRAIIGTDPNGLARRDGQPDSDPSLSPPFKQDPKPPKPKPGDFIEDGSDPDCDKKPCAKLFNISACPMTVKANGMGCQSEWGIPNGSINDPFAVMVATLANEASCRELHEVKCNPICNTCSARKRNSGSGVRCPCIGGSINSRGCRISWNASATPMTATLVTGKCSYVKPKVVTGGGNIGKR